MVSLSEVYCLICNGFLIVVVLLHIPTVILLKTKTTSFNMIGNNFNEW